MVMAGRCRCGAVTDCTGQHICCGSNLPLYEEIELLLSTGQPAKKGESMNVEVHLHGDTVVVLEDVESWTIEVGDLIFHDKPLNDSGKVTVGAFSSGNWIYWRRVEVDNEDA
jgi:hypothetical protein